MLKCASSCYHHPQHEVFGNPTCVKRASYELIITNKTIITCLRLIVFCLSVRKSSHNLVVCKFARYSSVFSTDLRLHSAFFSYTSCVHAFLTTSSHFIMHLLISIKYIISYMLFILLILTYLVNTWALTTTVRKYRLLRD